MQSLIFYLGFFPWTLLMMAIGIPLSFLSPDYLHNVARFWGRSGLWFGGARLEIIGSENVPVDQPLIFMPNHQSNFDILALFAAIPTQFRWLAKQELFAIPLFGLTMRRSGYIPVDRSDRKKALKSMRMAADRITDGTSVIVFPEGTRSPDGLLQPFKRGGFHLALQAGVQVVPVAIEGSHKVMAKDELYVHGGHIRVVFFPPMETSDLSIKELPTMMERIRQPIASRIAERPAA